LYIYTNEAQIRYVNATYSGKSHDGGKNELLKQIECFQAGLNRKTPECWNAFTKQYNKENDPEYKKYLELKKKFE